jgi:hypothetical protein
MTRIRYKMNKFEVLNSPEFLAIDKVVFVEIFNDFSAAIVQKGSGTALQILKSTNMQNIKKLVKKTLIEMGVVFKNEVRPRFKDIQYSELAKEGFFDEDDVQ